MPKARKVCDGCGSKRPRHTHAGGRWCRSCWDTEWPEFSTREEVLRRLSALERAGSSGSSVRITLAGDCFSRAAVLELVDHINEAKHDGDGVVIH